MSESDQSKKPEYDEINNAKGLFDKYAGHGRIDDMRAIVIFTPGNEPQNPVTPAAYGYGKEVCALVGISQDYSKLARSIGKEHIFDSEGMKGFMMAHEDMHCRIGNAEFSTDQYGNINTAKDAILQRFDTLANESVADSMAVLISARRDGVDASRTLLDNLGELRGRGDIDSQHDSRATLNLLRDTLNYPERFSTDEAAFKTAITTGVQGAVQTFPGQLSADDKYILKTKEFSDLLDSQAQRFTDALNTYRTGKYESTPYRITTLDPDIAKNYDQASPGTPSGLDPALNKKELAEFESQMKQILGEIKGGFENKLGAEENPYSRGRNMGPDLQGPTLSNAFSDRPTAPMRM